MTTNEFTQHILQSEENGFIFEKLSDTAINNLAKLISESFAAPLHQALSENGYDIDAIAAHLEKLYDFEELSGTVYFIFMLANAVKFELPSLFYEMCTHNEAIAYMAEAIVDEWSEPDLEDDEISGLSDSNRSEHQSGI